MGNNTLIRYSEELDAKVCEMIAMGKTVRQIANTPGMPKICTLYSWLEKHPDFKRRYAHARELSGQASECNVVEIVEKVEVGDLDSNAARVMLDAEKWLAAKRAPRTHGDKQTLEHTGADGGSIKVGLDDRQIRDLILAVTHDCPTCRERAAEKLLELERGSNGDG